MVLTPIEHRIICTKSGDWGQFSSPKEIMSIFYIHFQMDPLGIVGM